MDISKLNSKVTIHVEGNIVNCMTVPPLQNISSYLLLWKVTKVPLNEILIRHSSYLYTLKIR